jgi:hypothetical protein
MIILGLELQIAPRLSSSSLAIAALPTINTGLVGPIQSVYIGPYSSVHFAIWTQGRDLGIWFMLPHSLGDSGCQ